MPPMDAGYPSAQTHPLARPSRHFDHRQHSEANQDLTRLGFVAKAGSDVETVPIAA